MSKAPRVRSTKRFTTKDLAQPDCWDLSGGDKALKCLACLDRNTRDVRAALLHERVPTHQRAVKRFLEQRRQEAAACVMTGPSHPAPHAASSGRDLLDLFRTVSQAKNGGENREAGPPMPDSVPLHAPDWLDLPSGESGEQELDEDPMDIDHARQRLQGTLLNFLSGVHVDSDSDDESVGPCPSESSSSSSSDEEESAGMGTKAARVHNRTFDPKAPFFPWRNKQEVSLSILMHLARSVLSEHQLELLTWAFGFNGINDMPSVSSIKALDTVLQTFCGIETREYVGKMGHRYHVNSLADLIAQEHANPRISEHLHHLPVETDGPVSSPFESRKWLHEVDPSLATPMIRRAGQDFFVFEPTLLTPTSSIGRVCMPVRWFLRDGIRYARAWRLSEADVYSQDAGQPVRGWCVHEWETVDVPEHDLLLALPRFAQSHQAHELPSPHVIHGSFLTPQARMGASLTPWERTKPAVGNRWRQRAQGSEVRAFPIWLYCDDTSGNQSKKWNKHNSFLFTPAGLPREFAHQEYNVHFLTTSNIAPVPEMLDGVVNEIELCQQNGVWAFDHASQSVVLLIPFVLGLLGDNPMQSELACHIGMKGKFFCRICWVDRGKAEDDDASDDKGVAQPAAPATGGKRKRKPAETAREMLQRVKRFVTSGRLRNREETLATVNELDAKMRANGNLDAIRSLKTSTGVKDTSLQFFIDKIEAAMKGKRARAARETACERAKADLPAHDLRSAIFKLRGAFLVFFLAQSPELRSELDPHSDTPVEVLHVILIGVIKYFWRDIVKNQCSSDQKQRELIARLDSFDTSGLGISPLRGHTLVTYAGSLVGRDFRSIAQAAPFVLHGGLVSSDCYRAWVELATLVPLVWQPVIENMDEYIPRLSAAIDNLLAATAEWSPRWFNKPKFHLLLHLPSHIRRFGPAILFATEAFESFNAVIRAKSIHSNRQAPSRDIALGFAHSNRMRQLLSGGWIRPYQAPLSSAQDPKRAPSPEEKRAHRHSFRLKKPEASDFVRGGTRVVQLVELYSPVRSYMGIHDITTTPSIALSGLKAVPYQETVSFTKARLADIDPLEEVPTFRRVDLQSGDTVTPGNWVLVSPSPVNPPHSDTPVIAQVAEIVQHRGADGIPTAHILVNCPEHRPVINSSTYRMPLIPPLQRWYSVPAWRIICAANVQHNCARHNCAATGRRVILQERQRSTETRAVVAHRAIDDVVLNLGQMRSTVHLQKLTIARDTLDMTESIEKGIAKHFKSSEVASTTSGPAVASDALPPSTTATAIQPGGQRSEVPRSGETTHNPTHHDTGSQALLDPSHRVHSIRHPIRPAADRQATAIPGGAGPALLPSSTPTMVARPEATSSRYRDSQASSSALVNRGLELEPPGAPIPLEVPLGAYSTYADSWPGHHPFNRYSERVWNPPHNLHPTITYPTHPEHGRPQNTPDHDYCFHGGPHSGSGGYAAPSHRGFFGWDNSSQQR